MIGPNYVFYIVIDLFAFTVCRIPQIRLRHKWTLISKNRYHNQRNIHTNLKASMIDPAQSCYNYLETFRGVVTTIESAQLDPPSSVYDRRE